MKRRKLRKEIGTAHTYIYTYIHTYSTFFKFSVHKVCNTKETQVVMMMMEEAHHDLNLQYVFFYLSIYILERK